MGSRKEHSKRTSFRVQALTKPPLYIKLVNVLLVKKGHMAKQRVNVGGDYMKAHTGKHDSWGATHLTVYQKRLA